MREGEPIGVILLARQRVEPFTDRQIELVSTFADQAVIAIENTRLMTEQQEALEQQTATAEVLQVINASPGNLTPVFDAMLEKAMRLCGAAFGVSARLDGGAMSRAVAFLRVCRRFWQRTDADGDGLAQPDRSCSLRTSAAHRSDVTRWRRLYRAASRSPRAGRSGGARTVLYVPLLKDEACSALFAIYRQEVRAFSDKQIALLENFAAQAVIAMENARLITEQQRGAGTADRDRRGVAGDQRLAGRSGAGVRCDAGKGDAPV